MNNLLMWLAGLLALVFAALFAVPPMVDWNQYRGVFEEEASRLLGREVRVGGRVNLRILPVPYVGFEKVSISDAAGIPGPFLRAERFTLLLSVPPLLRGILEARELEIDEPFIRLRFDEKGGGNWQKLEIRQRQLVFVPSDVALQSARIRNGRISLETHLGDEIATVDKITGELATTALSGPYKFTGSATVADVPHEVRFSSATPSTDESVRFKLTVTSLETRARHTIDASLSDLASAPKIMGQLKTRAPIRLGKKAAGTPTSYDLTANLDLDPQRAKLNDISITFDSAGRPQLLSGSAEATWHDGLAVRGALVSKWLDLDAITGGVTTTNPLRVFDLVALSGFDMGKGGRGQFDVTLEQASLGGEVASALAVRLLQQGSQARIDRVTASLPGRTRLRADGRISSSGGTPALQQGHVLLRGQSLAKFLDWVKVGGVQVQGAGSGAFEFAGSVAVADTSATVSDINARFAGGRLLGALQYSWDKTPKLSVTADAESLDISGLGPDVLTPQKLAAILGLGSSKEAQSSAFARLFEGLDLDLRVRAEKIEDVNHRFSDVNALISRTGGKVRLARTQFVFEPGLAMELEGTVDGSQKTPAWNVSGVVKARTPDALTRLETIVEAVAGTNILPVPLQNAFLLELAFTSSAGPKGDTYQTVFNGDGALGKERVRLQFESDGPIATWRDAPLRLDVKVDGRSPLAIARLIGIDDQAQGSGPNQQAGGNELPTFARLNVTGIPRSELVASATLSGPDWQMRVSANGKAGSQKPAIAWSGHGQVEISDLPQMAQVFAPQLTALIRGKPGMSGVFDFTRGAKEWVVEPIGMRVGQSTVSGKLALRPGQEKSSERARVSGNLNIDYVDGVGLLSALLDPPSGRAPAVDQGANEAGPDNGESDFWSDRPFDFSPLQKFDADVRITSPKILLAPNLPVRSATLAIALNNGALRLTNGTGKVLGGELAATSEISSATAGATFKTSIKVANAKLVAFVTDALGNRVRGNMDAEISVSGQALSPRALVTALVGKGRVRLRNAKVPGLRPNRLSAVADKVVIAELDPASLNNTIASEAAQGAVELNNQDIGFVIRDGAAEFEPVRLASKTRASARNQTTIDLVRLQVDSEWQLETQLGAAVSAKAAAKPLPPVQLVYGGPIAKLAEIAPRIGIGDLQRELTVRRMEHDVNRLERLRREDEQRGRLEAERLHRQEQERLRALEAERRKRQQLGPVPGAEGNRQLPARPRQAEPRSDPGRRSEIVIPGNARARREPATAPVGRESTVTRDELPPVRSSPNLRPGSVNQPSQTGALPAGQAVGSQPGNSAAAAQPATAAGQAVPPAADQPQLEPIQPPVRQRARRPRRRRPAREDPFSSGN